MEIPLLSIGKSPLILSESKRKVVESPIQFYLYPKEADSVALEWEHFCCPLSLKVDKSYHTSFPTLLTVLFAVFSFRRQC